MRPRTRAARADFLLWSNAPGPACRGQAPARDPPMPPAMDIRLSEVISALSYALDLTEGQPMGHAVRSCAIGMRIGEEIGLDAGERSALFYALLLKDAGCSSNAARLSRAVRRRRPRAQARPQADRRTPARRSRRSRTRAARRAAPRRAGARSRAAAPRARARMTELRCERGAEIARMIELPEATAEAIRTLDEHWDGDGYPLRPGRRRDPAARPHRLPRPDRRGVLRRRRPARACSTSPPSAAARWFDPALVDALRADAPRPRVLGVARRPRAARA